LSAETHGLKVTYRNRKRAKVKEFEYEIKSLNDIMIEWQDLEN
jgi:hypothetical protein